MTSPRKPSRVRVAPTIPLSVHRASAAKHSHSGGAFSLRVRLTIERADALRAPHRSIGMGQWQQTVVGQGWRLLLLLQPAGRAAG